MTDSNTLSEPPENPAAPIKVRKIDRENMALDLRKQGASYRRIARQLKKQDGISKNYSEGGAYGDVMNALHRLLKKQKELAEENLRIDLDRLDELFAKFWPRAVPASPDKPPDLLAASFVLSVLDKRANLLNYASLFAAPRQPTALNVDVTKLSSEALKRIVDGEDPISVIASLSASGTGASQA